MIFKVEGPGLFDRLHTVAAVGMYGCGFAWGSARDSVEKRFTFPVGSYLPVFFEAVLALSAVASVSSSEGTDQPPPRAL